MIDYSHLLGRRFVWGAHDCFGLLKSFYQDIFGIELPDIARPEDFWMKGLDLFGDHYFEAGFNALERVHPTSWQFGDVVLSAIDSAFGNHVSIIVEGGKILHHLYGRLSTVEPMRGIVRNNMVGIFRHKDVDLSKIQVTETQDIRAFLTPRMQKRLDELRGLDPAAS